MDAASGSGSVEALHVGLVDDPMTADVDDQKGRAGLRLDIGRTGERCRNGLSRIGGSDTRSRDVRVDGDGRGAIEGIAHRQRSVVDRSVDMTCERVVDVDLAEFAALCGAAAREGQRGENACRDQEVPASMAAGRPGLVCEVLDFGVDVAVLVVVLFMDASSSGSLSRH